MLLKSGADIEATDNAGQTPLQKATGHSNSKRGSLWNFAYIKLTYWCLDQETMVDLLIKSGANVNALHADKRSSLHLACKKGNWEIFAWNYKRHN